VTESKVREITCPECDRVWPLIAEQGIVTEIHGKCYQCFIDQVVTVRDERIENADYLVQNCSSCGGLPPKVQKCISCAGKGWEAVDKGDESTPPKTSVIYPH
jgi:hypothetical protein